MKVDQITLNMLKNGTLGTEKLCELVLGLIQTADISATALIASKKEYDLLESHFKQKAAGEIRTLMLCMKPIEGESAFDYERRLTEIITNYGNGVKQ